MFYLGEFDEAEAKEVRGFLNKAGIRAEQRPSINVDAGTNYSLEGRLSRLKETIKDLEKYERSLAVLKNIFPRCKTNEEFNVLFMNELDPSWDDKKRKLLTLQESPESLTEEERDSITENSKKWTSDLIQSVFSISFAKTVLDRNGVKIGESLGDEFDDPLLDIPINLDDYDPVPENFKRNYRFNFFRAMAIYVDEITVLQAGDLDEKFQEKYSEESQKLRILGYLMEELVQSHPPQKMDLEEFAELCFIQKEDRNGCILIDGSSVAEELAKALEKGGVLKFKGKSIKWRI